MCIASAKPVTLAISTMFVASLMRVAEGTAPHSSTSLHIARSRLRTCVTARSATAIMATLLGGRSRSRNRRWRQNHRRSNSPRSSAEALDAEIVRAHVLALDLALFLLIRPAGAGDLLARKASAGAAASCRNQTIEPLRTLHSRRGSATAPPRSRRALAKAGCKLTCKR